MKIAYIGDLINHGTSLQTPGTSLIILLSEMEDVSKIDVYCPRENTTTEEFKIPKNVNIISFYSYDNFISISRLLSVRWKSYDLVIFNMLPTGFGKGTISNLMALITPLLLIKSLKVKNIKILYHNSKFTTDIKKLGYNSFYNSVRSYFLGKLERIIFKNIPTYVILDLYKERIDRAIGKNLVLSLDTRYLDAIPTIYINNYMDIKLIKIDKSDVPVILLHGFWGPQKNLELVLSTLFILRNEGVKFKLIISGGINTHFSNYKAKFNKLIADYSDTVDEYLGYVKEKEIMNIFLKSDLIILPYNTPGGHSGVLDQSMFFEVPTIAFDFPEYREQSLGSQNVKLIKPEELITVLKEVLNFEEKNDIINIESKIRFVRKNIKSILD